MNSFAESTTSPPHSMYLRPISNGVLMLLRSVRLTNPHTFFNGGSYAGLELWGMAAYGSPRYTHMHAAGDDPGDAAIHLMDMTISFDGRTAWDRGRFIFLDRPEIQEMIGADEREFLNSSVMQDIDI